ncbi:MAG: hypothetical protein ABIK28_23435 [Planctomycetota bacterium]
MLPIDHLILSTKRRVSASPEKVGMYFIKKLAAQAITCLTVEKKQ